MTGLMYAITVAAVILTVLILAMKIADLWGQLQLHKMQIDVLARKLEAEARAHDDTIERFRSLDRAFLDLAAQRDEALRRASW